MLFQHVAIAGLAHIDPPLSLSSEEINLRLKKTTDRLGITTDVLQDVAGIYSRRLWDGDMAISDAAVLAAEKAILDAGIPREKIGEVFGRLAEEDMLSVSRALAVFLGVI